MRFTDIDIREILFDSNISFEDKALMVFQYQYKQVLIYKKFSDRLKFEVNNKTKLNHYPFLPISFFKDHKIISKSNTEEQIFESSGTTGSINSKHYVADLKLYDESILNGFNHYYGDPSEFIIYALLPSYLERNNASLIYMVNLLMKATNHNENKFYKFNYDEFLNDVKAYNGPRKKLIIGVTFALWDLAEKFDLTGLGGCIISETGGMKGRRKEILRTELHQILTNAFKVQSIHSEYGMTELLSQAYSKGDGIFKCSSTMKVFVRDPYDPTIVKTKGKGVLNIIDLANLYSCSFIATNDLGEIFEDGSFKVIGRQDSTEIRGCNLMFGE